MRSRSVPEGVEVVLASASPHRAALLRAAGVEALVDPANIDERAHDDLLRRDGPERLAVELARHKAAAVAPRHPGAWIVAADQVAVVGEGGAAIALHQQDTVEGAVDQLVAMSGTTHRLVNAVVVMVAPSGPAVEGVDVQVVTMRPFTREEAERYVRRFRPFDSAGSYRVEDEDRLPPAERMIVAVEGEHPSGVIGLPLPLLQRLFADISDE